FSLSHSLHPACPAHPHILSFPTRRSSDLPLPSASRAESSSWSAPVSRLVINRAMDPAAAALPTGAAGKLTLKLSGVFVDMAPPPTGNKLEKSFSVPVWLTATPDSLMPIGLGPELVLFWT